eukprot:scaffold179822_cov31-Tisochrysis_lutea.AAC.9
MVSLTYPCVRTAAEATLDPIAEHPAYYGAAILHPAMTELCARLLRFFMQLIPVAQFGRYLSALGTVAQFPESPTSCKWAPLCI